MKLREAIKNDAMVILAKSARVTSQGINRIILYRRLKWGFQVKLTEYLNLPAPRKKKPYRNPLRGDHLRKRGSPPRWFGKDYATHHFRLFTFEDGSDRASIDCYMHTDEYKMQGFCEEKKVEVGLTKPFS